MLPALLGQPILRTEHPIATLDYALMLVCASKLITCIATVVL